MSSCTSGMPRLGEWICTLWSASNRGPEQDISVSVWVIDLAWLHDQSLLQTNAGNLQGVPMLWYVIRRPAMASTGDKFQREISPEVFITVTGPSGGRGFSSTLPRWRHSRLDRLHCDLSRAPEVRAAHIDSSRRTSLFQACHVESE
jgi:hypothetical protein